MDTVAWLTPLVLLPGVALLVLSTSARYGQIHQEFHHLVAEKVGRSRAAVANAMRLLGLSSEVQGEASGSYMHYVVNEALKHSTGELEAVLIWEGGDSITRLTVKDGDVNETDIEL